MLRKDISNKEKNIWGFLKNPKKARCEPVFFSLEGY